jgi:hypothetical protein
VDVHAGGIPWKLQKRRTTGKPSVNAPNTREKIGNRKSGSNVRFINVDVVLCYRKSVFERTLRGHGGKKEEN